MSEIVTCVRCGASVNAAFARKFTHDGMEFYACDACRDKVLPARYDSDED